MANRLAAAADRPLAVGLRASARSLCPALCLAWLATGCTGPSRESVLDPMIGEDIETAIQAFGPPAETVDLGDGQRAYLWRRVYKYDKGRRARSWPERRLVVVFQPHRYSRTHDLFDDFIKVLSSVDVLVLGEVYAAGQTPISGADGRALSRGIRARGQVDPVFVEDLGTLPTVLKDLLQDGDVLLTLGAGDIGSVAARLAGELADSTR